MHFGGFGSSLPSELELELDWLESDESTTVPVELLEDSDDALESKESTTAPVELLEDSDDALDKEDWEESDESDEADDWEDADDSEVSGGGPEDWSELIELSELWLDIGGGSVPVDPDDSESPEPPRNDAIWVRRHAGISGSVGALRPAACLEGVAFGRFTGRSGRVFFATKLAPE